MIEKNATDAGAIYQLALLCERQGAFARAEDLARKDCTLRPKSSLAFGLLARAILQAGRPAEAAAIFNEIWDSAAAYLRKTPKSEAPAPAAPADAPLTPFVYLP